MSDTNVPVSRRQFCAGACTAATGATLATLFSGCGGDSSSPTSPSGGGMPSMLTVLNGLFAGSTVQVAVGQSPLADVGGAALVQSTAGVFLLAQTSANVFTAVEGVCTHEGCTINGADGTTYVCPCHGSRYNRNGQVLAGPARSSLRTYRTAFANGVVTITL